MVDPECLSDRKRVFGDNRLPNKPIPNILWWAWEHWKDGTFPLLTVAALTLVALGTYRTVQHSRDEDENSRFSWPEGVAICVAIIIVVLLNAADDWMKEKHFTGLSRRADDRLFEVIRSGKVRIISVHDVLVGDVALLEIGDIVPADGILIEGHGVKCDESKVTGESNLMIKTLGKKVQRLKKQGHIWKEDLDSFFISGSTVVKGTGSFLVTLTGAYLFQGKILMSTRSAIESTPLQRKLSWLAVQVARIGVTISLILFLVPLSKFAARIQGSGIDKSLNGLQFLSILIIALTLADVLLPSGLPLAVTVALGFTTSRLLKANVLVRDLRCCETLGYTTTICTEITGALTENSMVVVAATFGSKTSFENSNPELSTNPAKELIEKTTQTAINVSATQTVLTLHPEVRELLKMCIISSSVAVENENNGHNTFVGSRTECALLGFSKKFFGMAPLTIERNNHHVVDFKVLESPEQGEYAVVQLAENRFRMLVKDTADILLEKCRRIMIDPQSGTEAMQMTPETRELLYNNIARLASKPARMVLTTPSTIGVAQSW